VSGDPRPGGGLRARILLAHLTVIAVAVGTLFLATLVIAPTLFERAMGGMMGPGSGMGGGMMTGLQAQVDDAFRGAMFQALLISAGAGSIAAVAVSLFVAGRILTPLRRLLGASRRIAAGHYAERVPADATGELGALAGQFNQMAEALDAAEQRRVALIGDVTHELRTPLATIEGYAEGLLDGVVAPGPETWALLRDEAARLRRLVADLQELSRAEAHQLPLHIAPADPAALAAQATARLAPQFAEKGVALSAEVPPGLPRVLADPDRILQVLVNLLGNALRYTPAGGRVCLAVARAPGAVAFHVRDSGIGIAPEHLAHVFERFYRVDKARSRALGGSGIGLTIAQALVEAHGGRLWAESPGPGQGAVFSFTLPVAA